MPGLGHSSPIVWDDLTCVTTAVSEERDPQLKVGLYGAIESVPHDTVNEWKVLCFDKRTGREHWQRTAHRGVPRIRRHPKSTHANSTLATDGRFIVAFFGSEGLYAYDMKGTLVWKKDLGVLDAGFFMVPDAQWETGSSPAIVDGKVLLQVDVQKGSFVAAFDVATGRELWRTPRSDVPTWSTPTVDTAGPRPQVVVNGFRHAGGYDLQTGRELWRLSGGGDIPVPTPILAHGLIYLTSSHGPASPVFAVRPTARGDISLQPGSAQNEHVAWSDGRVGAYMITPIVYGDYLYVARNNGVLTVYEAKTGARIYQQRLGDGRTGFTSSPVAADGKIYFASEDGDVYVVRAGATFDVLGQNRMGEICMATPAITEGMLLFRTKGHLVAIRP